MYATGELGKIETHRVDIARGRYDPGIQEDGQKLDDGEHVEKRENLLSTCLLKAEGSQSCSFEVAKARVPDSSWCEVHPHQILHHD